jgi:hypothetical protein
MKTLKQLLEDIQTGYAPKEISYKGYTTKNLHHVPDATKAFQATITRVEKGTLEDNGEVLDSLKNTDTYMKLNDMHLEQEKDLDPSELQQWLKSHEAAKQALTKIGEFEHHYDYWNSHNSELQYLKANQNMPQETESVEESIDFKKEAAKHMKDLHSKDSTPANKEYAQKMLRRALEASKMKDPVAAKKHYTGVSENFGADFLAMAKERNPNARLVTPEQKKKEAEELAKKRAELKPAHAAPTGNPRPLGGYDPKSNRSYSEEVETIEEGPYSSGQLKPSKGMEDQEKKAVTSRTSTIRGRDSKGVYTATMKDGKEVSKVYEENINELSKTTLGSYIKKRSHDVATMGAVTRKYAMDSDAKKKEHGAYTNAARELDQKSNRAFMKGWKHRENIGKAVDRLTKEEVVAEASPKDKIKDDDKPFNYADWAKSGKKPRALPGWGPKGFSTRLFKDDPKGKKDKDQGVAEEVELDEKTLTPAELKKREEIAKAMERKNPNMDKSRKMAIATAVAKRVAEQHDDAE